MVQNREAIEYLTLAWDYIEWIDKHYPDVYDKYIKDVTK